MPATPDLDTRVDCVLFDLYGTLVDIIVDEDTDALWSGLGAALAASNERVAPREVRQRYLAFMKEEGARREEGFLMEPVFRRLIASFGARIDVGRLGGMFRELSLKVLAVRSYVEPLFDVLRRSRTRIAIVSNTEAVLTRYDLERFPRLLTADSIVLSSDVGVRKPDARIFHIALEQLHAAATCAVFVGNDWASDIVGAQQAGVGAIYINDRVVGAEARPVESVPGRVVEAAPRLESILAALRLLGWRGPDDW